LLFQLHERSGSHTNAVRTGWAGHMEGESLGSGTRGKLERETRRRRIITQHLVRFSPRWPNRTRYLVLALRSPVLQIWLREEKKGVALQSVNVEDFRRLPVPMPPMEEQQAIVRRADQLLTLADELQRRVDMADREVERTGQAILAKAFRGDLIAEAQRGPT